MVNFSSHLEVTDCYFKNKHLKCLNVLLLPSGCRMRFSSHSLVHASIPDIAAWLNQIAYNFLTVYVSLMPLRLCTC